jgi:sugar phosphate isomerase/epimerase
MDIAGSLGVQTFCFREFDIERTVAAVKECGLSTVELCGFGVHFTFDDAAAFDKTVATVKDAGISIPAMTADEFADDEAAERVRCEFAQRAGAKVLMIGGFDLDKIHESFRTAEKLAEEFDMVLGIHNHGGRHAFGNSEMLRWVFKNTSKRIGLLLDTAWALDAHEDPIAMIREFGDRVHGVHFKDFIFDRKGEPEDVVLGTGVLDMPGVLKALDDVGFDGSAVIEYEGEADNPTASIKKCAEAIKALL